MFKTIEWTDHGVVMMDQRRLPLEERYVTCRNYRELAEAIRDMVIRGAPAIGVAAAMGMALAAQASASSDAAGLERDLEEAGKALLATRPTAVNLAWALDRMLATLRPLPPNERREDRKSTRLNSSHIQKSRMPSSA